MAKTVSREGASALSPLAEENKALRSIIKRLEAELTELKMQLAMARKGKRLHEIKLEVKVCHQEDDDTQEGGIPR